MQADWGIWRPRLAALAVSAAGAGVGMLVGLPLPLLLGPIFAGLLAGLFGVPLAGLPFVGTAARTVLGVAAGTAITPDLVQRLDTMAASVALVPLYIVSAAAIGFPYFRRLCGFDPVTAYFSAMPGGLQDMLAFGQDAGADPRALSLVHVTRVLVIVSAVPALLTLVRGYDLHAPLGPPAASIPPAELAIMLGCAVAGLLAGRRLGLFGAPVLGPMALAAAATLTGLVDHRPPGVALEGAQFFIGLGLGAAYLGVTVAEVRRVIVAALGYCIILALLSLLFADLAHVLTGAGWIEALLAFAPGGQSEMILLAIVAGTDIAYVVTHHVVRLALVILCAPLALRLSRPRR